jgi:hypothetical protein
MKAPLSASTSPRSSWVVFFQGQVGIPGAVGSLVPVHVAISGEGLSAKLAGERALTGVDEHVPVQGAE